MRYKVKFQKLIHQNGQLMCKSAWDLEPKVWTNKKEALSYAKKRYKIKKSYIYELVEVE